jgi:hypothetical protein
MDMHDGSMKCKHSAQGLIAFGITFCSEGRKRNFAHIPEPHGFIRLTRLRN